MQPSAEVSAATISTMSKPNILFIMCDQLRHDWLGYRGAAHVRTPNIDRIAARGMVYTEAITNSPVCAPARIGLATGMRPHHLGALDNHAFLPLSQRTYYQQLRDHGYRVGCVGKLDLAKPYGDNGPDGTRPLTYAWGFTDPVECEGKMHAGRGDPPNGPYTNWLHDTDPEAHAAFTADYRGRAGKGAAAKLHDSVVPAGQCEDDYIGQRALDLMAQYSAGAEPWHLFVSFVGPHNPFGPAPSWAERWRDADMPDPIPCEPEGRPPRYDQKHTAADHDWLSARRQYTAYLEQIDFQIGRLLDALAERGALDDTVLVFSADHGEMLGDHGRYTKSCPYESALRIPMIVAAPQLAPGTCDQPVELIDLAATICELAGVPALPNSNAISLSPTLANPEAAHRDIGYATHRGFGIVRDREWKLVRGDDRLHELYDLANDPDERHNLITELPDRAKQMEQRWAVEWAGSPLR